METGLYRQYLKEFVKEAVDNSDGTTVGISAYLWEKKVSGLLVRNKKEKNFLVREFINRYHST